MEKSTYINLGKFFELDPRTISTYQKNKPHLYKAMREYYEKLQLEEKHKENN